MGGAFPFRPFSLRQTGEHCKQIFLDSTAKMLGFFARPPKWVYSSMGTLGMGKVRIIAGG
jgi:hypothetical protein